MILECVIQIKAMADTPRRLVLRVNQAAAGRPESAALVRAVLDQLLAYERWFDRAVEATLGADSPNVPAPPAPESGPVEAAGSHGSPIGTGALLSEFAAKRHAVVNRLDRCSATQLGRLALLNGRGPTTLADLVALAFAHETDQLARLVRPAGDSPSFPATRA